MKRVVLMLLVIIGFTGAVSRAADVLEDPSTSAGLSRLDQLSIRIFAALSGEEAGSAGRRDIDDQNGRLVVRFYQHRGATLVHVIPAALFMLLLPLQFSRGIRTRRPGWHRWAGRLIVTFAVPIGISGLFFGVLIPFSGALEVSAAAAAGAFFLLSAARGFVAIRRRDIAAHRAWMTRLGAVALAVATIRIVGVVLAVVTSRGPEQWLGSAMWIGFGVTIMAAELRIKRSAARVVRLAT